MYAMDPDGGPDWREFDKTRPNNRDYLVTIIATVVVSLAAGGVLGILFCLWHLAVRK